MKEGEFSAGPSSSSDDDDTHSPQSPIFIRTTALPAQVVLSRTAALLPELL